MSGRFAAYSQPLWRTGADKHASLAPEPLRWHPMPIEAATAHASGCDFVDGLRALAANGDADSQTGVAAHLYLANRSMLRRALVMTTGESARSVLTTLIRRSPRC